MSRRDEQIDRITAATDELDPERLRTFYAHIREGYQQSSFVDRVAVVRDVNDREPSGFRVLANQELRRIEHFNDKSYLWDSYCRDLGRSVALGEKHYLFERLKDGVADGPRDGRLDFTGLATRAVRMQADGLAPDALFAPVSLMASFLHDHQHEMRWDQNGHPLWTVAGQPVEVFWSSGDNPLDRFILINRMSGEWQVKVDRASGTRLTIAIGTQPAPRGVVWLAQTVAKFEITDQRGFRSFRPSLEPDEGFDVIR